MSQESLFDLGCSPAPRRPQAADATRRTGKSCWRDCAHCTMSTFTQVHKRPDRMVYKMCHYDRKNPQPVFEHDMICEHVLERAPAAPPKPTTRGWDDY